MGRNKEKLAMEQKDNGQIMDMPIEKDRTYPLKYKMISMCAFRDCKKVYGYKMASEPNQISHGYCPECMKKHYSEFMEDEK
ncbi:hypothetical protein LCGC14_1475320 [marine sediment metagenome]|uniref:Uncharacterized protein n=1 Tax=marine sediment metagenome TaxID=412755 RepID=A0A0F9JX27_9ZZZZ|nr:hypothetical protein [Pricia sp.]